MIEEENSVTALFPVAPKRCGRGAEPYSYSEKLAESDSQQPEGVTPWRNNHGWQNELSKPDGHAATFEDNSGCQWGGSHDQR